MDPDIKTLPEKKLVCLVQTMSLSHNRTVELWKNFMPRKKEILNGNGADRYSIQTYPPGYFENFNPGISFEKRAAMEVSDFECIPAGMEAFVLPGGTYAVFNYKGLSSDTRIFQYIFSVWLPASGYILDHRPHFEILGEKYKNLDPDSEEEIWIPVKKKTTIPVP